MSHGDIRDVWKLEAIERKADEAHRRLYELDSLRSDVGSLERTNRELSSTVDGLRYELQDLQECFRQLTESVAILEGG